MTQHPTPDEHWQTALFLAASSAPAAHPGTISARRAYQHGLYGRAVLVDERSNRDIVPDMPAATSVSEALAGGTPVVVLLSDAPAQAADERVRHLAGGVREWVRAGLPVRVALPLAA